MTDAARVDLLARRQARLEANGAPRLFEFGDDTFEGPAELPLEFIELVRQGRFVDALRVIFGERGDEFVRVVHPTIDDMKVIAEVYGSDLASSSASIGS